MKKNIDFEDPHAPEGVCESCRSSIRRLSGVNSAPLPELFDFESVKLFKETRATTICECLICDVAGVKGKSVHPMTATSNSGKKKRTAKGRETLFKLTD